MANKVQEKIRFMTRIDSDFQDKLCELTWMKEEQERLGKELEPSMTEVAEIEMRKKVLLQSLNKFKNVIEEVF